MMIRPTIQEMQVLAEAKGGKCRSQEYVHTHHKLLWRCKEGHIWETTPHQIKIGRWCHQCAAISRPIKRRRHSIEEMQKVAAIRGGKCLSTAYKNFHSKLTWQCKLGHNWDATPAHIMHNRWCPMCATGIGERICRAYFETIFDEKFPKSRPQWLINSKNNQMELDGYCENLQLAFEYQGHQHYMRRGLYRGTTLAQRKNDDALKRKLCQLHVITLIEVPYNIDFEDMGNYIVAGCRKRGVQIPNSVIRDIDFSKVYSPEKLTEMQQLAASRGGKCLSTEYVSSHSKLKWQCQQGHTWEAIPTSVKAGHWCPYCAGIVKLPLYTIKKLAQSRGGTLLSTRYHNAKTKLQWRCAIGHEWQATQSDVKQGKWCPHCAGIVKLTLNEMHRIAASRKGKCLSKRYINNRMRLKWRCKEGHIWNAAPRDVKSGTWCPNCGFKRFLQANKRRKLPVINNFTFSNGSDPALFDYPAE